ncbi:MAG: GrpB family protein [Gaiellaceae bacterium]
MEAAPIALVDVSEVADLAQEVTASFERDFVAAVANAEVHHVGATSLPFGHTKGDVDLNVRVDEAEFHVVVDALRQRLAVAQPDNWTETFASFSSDAYSIPLGVQVTVIGSPDDFLLALRDRMRADGSLLRRYDDIKLATASSGADAYWQAKDALLREVLDE